MHDILMITHILRISIMLTIYHRCSIIVGDGLDIRIRVSRSISLIIDIIISPSIRISLIMRI